MTTRRAAGRDVRFPTLMIAALLLGLPLRAQVGPALEPSAPRAGDAPLTVEPALDPVPAHRWTRGLPPPLIPGFHLARVNPQGFPEYDLVLSWDVVPRVPAVTMRFVLIPAGTYAVGADAGEELGQCGADPRSQVTVDAFLIARTECTLAQWEAVMGRRPAALAAGQAEAPVHHVSWPDIQWFERRTRLALPSAVQWELAARGGRDQGWLDGLIVREWHKANADGAPHTVAQLPPNGFGLHDMLGNLREWCEDGLAPRDATGLPGDGTALRRPGLLRMVRGGAWHSTRDACDPRARMLFNRGARGATLGFRPMRPLRPGALVPSDAAPDDPPR